MVSRELRLRCNNQGSTLIEIIVSVLIVGIVFVPLLMGLNTAVNVNKKSESELYAETMADSCMEITKAFGVVGLRDYIDNSPGAVLDNAVVTEYLNKSIAFGKAVKLPELSTDAVVAADDSVPDNPKHFVVSNLKEGTKDYYADITFSTAKYNGEGKQNSSSGYSAVNNVTSSKTYIDDTADGVRDEQNYQRIKEEADQTAIEKGYTDLPEGYTLDYIKNTIVLGKETVLTIQYLDPSKTYTDSGDLKHIGSYKITKEFYYTLKDNDAGKVIFGDTTQIKSQWGGKYKDTVSSRYLKECPDTIILPLSTLKAPTEYNVNPTSGTCTDKLTIKKVDVDQTEMHEIKVYLLMKGVNVYVEDFSVYTSQLDIKVENDSATFGSNANNLKIFGPTARHSGTGTYKYYKFNESGLVDIDGDGITDDFALISTAGDDDIKKMYEVTIKIYDYQNQLVAQKTSSLIDFDKPKTTGGA